MEENEIKISEFNSATTINDSDLIPIVQSNETKNITFLGIKNVINNYSTNEQVIGTWVDGKPIYRKVVYISALPNATQGSYATGVSDPEQSVNCYGFTTSGLSLNCVRPLSTSSSIGCWFDTSSNQIKIETAIDRSSLSAYVTIEYTKTTD